MRMVRQRSNEQPRNQPIRPVFEANQLQKYGVWIELVPHRVRMLITQPGNGLTPSIGQFVRLKQYIYREDMSQIRAQRVTYLVGRQQLLPGMEICMSMCREGMKARCFLAAQFAYGNKRVQGIAPNTSLVIDIQISTITNHPTVRDQFQDSLFLKQIKTLEREGDDLVQKNKMIDAQQKYQLAFELIQSNRCKQIKNYIYSTHKSIHSTNHHQREEQLIRQIEEDKVFMVKLYQVFDVIKIKTIETVLKNRDYYRVIYLTKECLVQGSRLEMNQTVLFSRGKALVAVGQLTSGIEIIKNLSDKFSNNLEYQEELKRSLQKKEKVEKKIKAPLLAQPILSFTEKKPKSNKKQKIKPQKKIKTQPKQTPLQQEQVN